MKTDLCGKIRRYFLASTLCSAALTAAPAASGAEPTASPPSTPPPYILVFRLSETALQSHASGGVDTNSRIDEVILGTQVGGQARVRGNFTVDLVEDADHGKFLITMRGTAAGNSTGRNGPAIIHSRSQTSFVATKRVLFEPGEGFFTQPAKVAANTVVENAGIDSTRGGIAGRVVRRVAAGEVAANREPARQIAEEIARRKIEAAFEGQVARKFAKLNQSIEQRMQFVKKSQLGRNLKAHCASTADGVLIGLRLADAPYAPLQLPAYRHEARGELWVHESLLGPDVAAQYAELRKALTDNREMLVSTLGDQVAPANGAGLDRLLRPGSLRSDRVEDWVVLQPARSGALPPALVAHGSATGGRPLR